MKPRFGAESGEIDVDRLIDEHGASMLRVARRFSDSAEDAEDAFQRAVEKLLTRAPADRRNLAAWLATVVRNEALMIRRSERNVQPSDAVYGESTQSTEPSPEDALIAAERSVEWAEAIRRLRPDQIRCLLLRADGLSHPEIAERTGFGEAKIQRILWEGRRAFRTQLDRVESGLICARVEPMLSAYADDAISDAGRREVELHIKDCLACKTVLREFRSIPRDVAALLPLGAAPIPGGAQGAKPFALLDHVQNWIGDRLATLSGQLNSSEVAFAKGAALAGVAVASLVAGGYGVERMTAAEPSAGGFRSAASAAVRAEESSAPEGVSSSRRIRASSPAPAETSPPLASAAELVEASGVPESTAGGAARDEVGDPAPDELPGEGAGADAPGDTATAFEGAPTDAELLGEGE